MNKEREILKWSDPSKVQKKANQYFSKKTPVLLSTRKDKKYMVKSPEEKYIHFGQMGFQDFTVHKDKARRASYLNRSSGIKGKDKYSPNQLSRNLLW